MGVRGRRQLCEPNLGTTKFVQTYFGKWFQGGHLSSKKGSLLSCLFAVRRCFLQARCVLGHCLQHTGPIVGLQRSPFLGLAADGTLWAPQDGDQAPSSLRARYPARTGGISWFLRQEQSRIHPRGSSWRRECGSATGFSPSTNSVH